MRGRSLNVGGLAVIIGVSLLLVAAVSRYLSGTSSPGVWVPKMPSKVLTLQIRIRG